MLDPCKLIIDAFVEQLDSTYQRLFGIAQSDCRELLLRSAELVVERLRSCDALYHDLEHTVMVTQAGQAILEGKHLSEESVTPRRWLNFTLALLCHDIGYVRGICKADRGALFSTGTNGQTVRLPAEGTSVVLAPYHVDRGKLFVREQFGQDNSEIDVEYIADCIEMTRFPIPQDAWYQQTKNDPALVRAGDLIGQMGDPAYLRKLGGLFYEFHETGVAHKLGYYSPSGIRRSYPQFYRDQVSPYIKEGLRLLRLTEEGRLWITSLQNQIHAARQDR